MALSGPKPSKFFVINNQAFTMQWLKLYTLRYPHLERDPEVKAASLDAILAAKK